MIFMIVNPIRATPNTSFTLPSDAMNFSLSGTVVNEGCPGANDGSIDLTITGAIPPVQVLWMGPGSFTSIQEDISNLSPGQYTATVIDGAANTGSLTLTVSPGIDSVPPVLLNVPSDDTLDCTNPIPADPVTAIDNCGPVTLIPTNSVSSFECTQGLAAWFAAEGNTDDATGNLTASQQNGVTFTQGIVGSGLALDGNDDYIVANQTVNLSSSGYTILFWIKNNSPGNQVVFSAADPVTGVPRILVRLAGGQIQFSQQDDSGIESVIESNDQLGYADDSFHQVSIEKDGSAMRIRVDNQVVATGTGTGQMDEALKVTWGRFFIHSLRCESKL